MLSLKDLVNRVYRDKKCIAFDYEMIIADADNLFLRAMFTKQIPSGESDSKVWRMQIIIPRTRDCDSQVYNFVYEMPKLDVPLELIAGTGLRFFQLYLKEEVQTKSLLDFEIGELLKGM